MYLTIKETAEYLSITESTVKGLIQQKKIRALYPHSGENNRGQIDC